MSLYIPKKMTFTLLLVIFFIGLDNFLKKLALKGDLTGEKCLISNIFCLNFIPNYNISFSLPLNGFWLIFTLALILLFLLVYLVYLIKTKDENKAYLLTILLIGAIINLLDRIKYGYVIDYFDLRYFTIFNVGDTMISGSVLILIILVLKGER